MPNNTGRPADWYEPPTPPECPWCDNTGIVDVERIIDVMGKRHNLKGWEVTVEVTCPRCVDGRIEPRPIEEG